MAINQQLDPAAYYYLCETYSNNVFIDSTFILNQCKIINQANTGHSTATECQSFSKIMNV